MRAEVVLDRPEEDTTPAGAAGAAAWIEEGAEEEALQRNSVSAASSARAVMRWDELAAAVIDTAGGIWNAEDAKEEAEEVVSNPTFDRDRRCRVAEEGDSWRKIPTG